MAQDISIGPTYRSFELLTAANKIRGATHVVLRGQNATIGTTPETYWVQSGAYTWNSAAVLEITSTDNVADNAAGTGALTVTIEGLNASYAEISETIVMDGQTNSDTTAAFLRVNRMYVATSGSGGVNAGTIYASTGAQVAGVPSVASTIRMTIAAGEGESRAALYTVPAGKVAYVTDVVAATSDGTNNVLTTFRSRVSATAPWLIKDAFVILAGTTRIPHDMPLVFPAASDLELIGDASASTVDAYGSFSLILLDA